MAERRRGESARAPTCRATPASTHRTLMDTERTNVLLISDRPSDHARLGDALAGDRRAGAPGFALVGRPLLPEEGLLRLGGGGIDVLLLDVRQSAEQGLDTLVRAR